VVLATKDMPLVVVPLVVLPVHMVLQLECPVKEMMAGMVALAVVQVAEDLVLLVVMVLALLVVQVVVAEQILLLEHL
jgi:CDP-diacylglycerol pyrophosphatase